MRGEGLKKKKSRALSLAAMDSSFRALSIAQPLVLLSSWSEEFSNTALAATR